MSNTKSNEGQRTAVESATIHFFMQRDSGEVSDTLEQMFQMACESRWDPDGATLGHQFATMMRLREFLDELQHHAVETYPEIEQAAQARLGALMNA